MGLLKNIVNTAVRDGVRRGVSNAVGTAVGKALGNAIEGAVKPAADNLAKESAKAIDNAANEMNKGIAETKAAAVEAGAAATEAKAALGGLAGLEATLTGLAAQAEKYATKASANIKVCPSCGQPSPADKAFCPNCGTKLPEKTLGQDYICTKCGTANTPGTKYCSACGAILPGAEAEIKAQQEKDAKVLEEFAATLPQYPKWDVGGKEFCFEKAGDTNGHPIYRLSLEGAYDELYAYLTKLTEAGFTKRDDQFWKTVDGVCRTVDTTDAICDGGVNISFYVSDYDKKVTPKPAEDPLADLKGAAKGIFKSFLK